MAEYIERDKVLEAILNLPPKMDEQGYGWLGRAGVWQMILDFQSADVAPVVHGKWEDSIAKYGILIHICSVCNKYSHMAYNYCPNCGAKMDDKDINVPCKTKRERNRCLSLFSLQKQNEEMQEVANKDAFYGEALND